MIHNVYTIYDRVTEHASSLLVGPSDESVVRLVAQMLINEDFVEDFILWRIGEWDYKMMKYTILPEPVRLDFLGVLYELCEQLRIKSVLSQEGVSK